MFITKSFELPWGPLKWKLPMRRQIDWFFPSLFLFEETSYIGRMIGRWMKATNKYGILLSLFNRSSCWASKRLLKYQGRLVLVLSARFEPGHLRLASIQRQKHFRSCESLYRLFCAFCVRQWMLECPGVPPPKAKGSLVVSFYPHLFCSSPLYSWDWNRYPNTKTHLPDVYVNTLFSNNAPRKK